METEIRTPLCGGFLHHQFRLAAHSQIDAGAAHGALEVAGRDRRYYSLTPAGRKQLAPLRQEWRTFLHALDSLAGVSHA